MAHFFVAFDRMEGLVLFGVENLALGLYNP